MKNPKAWMAAAAATAALGAAMTGTVLALSPGGAASAAGAATHRGASECRADDIRATYHAVDAGAGHRFGRITVQNVSATSCWVRGFGGLSYVGDGNGTQIGAAAVRIHSRTPTTVLKPGDRVGSAVSEAEAGDYSTSTCRPTSVDGFRVYLPDETHSVYVPHQTTGCADDSVRLLTHKAFH